VSLVDDLVTIADWLRLAATRFAAAELHYGHGTDNAWDEAVALLRGALGLPHDKLQFVLDARLTRKERRRVLEMIDARVGLRVPVSYLTGEAYFAGRSYRVTRDVLIPRSPIAELIEAGFEPWITQPPESILDLCAGSGCIGIACGHRFPDATVVLSDVDPRALAVARENVDRHGVGDRVEVVESDLFASLEGRVFDLIVTNPPYVNAEDLAAMPQEFRHEPVRALAAGLDGLDVVRRILQEALRFLRDEGSLVGEVGASAPALLEAFPTLPFEWPLLQRGGDGVFVLHATRLPAY